LPKSPKLSKRSAIIERKFRRNLAAITLTALVIKVFIILRIQGFDWYQAAGGDLGKGLGILLDNNYAPPNAWYGADGENYIRGLQGLVEDGLYSKEGKLSYWPAGYPILMWPIIELFRGYFFLVFAILQSFLYAFASIWFVDEVRKTRISKVSYFLALLLAFNPTLTLNTIAIGYELPVVSLSLISVAALLRYFSEGKSSWISGEVILASLAFSFASFMQPRLLVVAVGFFFLWAISKFKLIYAAPFLAVTLGLVSIAPGILTFRNKEAQGYAAISTNLGVTMRLGAGPEATGGYKNQGAGTVQCPEVKGSASEADRATVKCVIDWYLDNPTKALVLFWNKARYFWSPWFGPEANGTMARNPWSQNHPLRSSVQTESGFKMIFGGFGKITSWIWMICGLLSLCYGFLLLWRLGDLERLLALIAASAFLINIVSSMLTIGDHRFRIPSMGMSILLQVVGIRGVLFRKEVLDRRGQSLVTWPAIKREKFRRVNP